MSFVYARPRASQLRTWHEETRDAVDARELDVGRAMATSSPVPLAILGMTESEVRKFYEAMRRELDASVCLMLLAEAEAVLRVDYKVRISERKKDDVSRKFRDIDKSAKARATKNGGKKARVRLDLDLLDTWVETTPACKSAVSAFRGVLKLRHWLAHGRYWVPHLPANYSAADAFAIADALFQALGVTGWA